MTVTSTPNTNHKPTQRSRRLRKKLHLEEFAIFGFELECEFKTDLSDAVLSEFIDHFFIDAIVEKGLVFSGGLSSKRLSGFITAQKRHLSVTETERQALESWLKTQAPIASAQLGQLLDANDYN